MNKTIVRMRNNDNYDEYKKGEYGFILGFVFNGSQPFVSVAIGNKCILCLPTEIDIVNNEVTEYFRKQRK